MEKYKITKDDLKEYEKRATFPLSVWMLAILNGAEVTESMRSSVLEASHPGIYQQEQDRAKFLEIVITVHKYKPVQFAVPPYSLRLQGDRIVAKLLLSDEISRVFRLRDYDHLNAITTANEFITELNELTQNK